MPGKMEGILPLKLFQNVFPSCIKDFLLVLETFPTPKQDLAIVFWQGDWDVCLGMVTDLQSSHSVDVVGS